MFFSDISFTAFIVLMLPAVLNLWTIWHAMNHRFPQEKERFLWMLAGIFLPVLGGVFYLVWGYRRSMPLQR